MNAPLVGVVTPFHNAAPHLDECIRSVRAQTHRDFSYILLDNCSTDDSLAIAQLHAREDPRIRLERNDVLLDQVTNYNRAIELVEPDARYVKVVQADDAIFPRCLEEMVALAEAHPSIAIVSSYRLRGDNLDGGGLPFGLSLLSGRAACRLHLLDGIFLFGSPTTLLFRGDVVRSRRPFWTVGRLHEDTETVFEILRSHDFGFVQQVLSFSRIDPSSITGAVRGFAPHRLDKLILLERYGRDFLSDEELSHCAADYRGRYQRFLAEAWLDRREPAFWDYQRRGLATIDERIEFLSIARHVAPALVDSVIGPRLLGAFRKVVRAVLRRT